MAVGSGSTIPESEKDIPPLRRRGTDRTTARPDASSGQLEEVRHVSTILKALAHESRLIILCALLKGEKSVSELEELLGLRQPAVSQQLARLRGDRLVSTHRKGKMIFYTLSDDPQVRTIVRFLCGLFRKKGQASSPSVS